MSDQTLPRRSSAKRRTLRVVVGAGFFAVWFFCPLPVRSIGSLEVEHASHDNQVRELSFVCIRTSQEIAFRGVCRLTQGQLHIDLLDTNGRMLAGPFLLAGRQNENWTFVTNGGFPVGRSFRLRCTPLNAVGRYSIAVSQPYAVSGVERILALGAILFVVLIILSGLWLLGIRRDVLGKPVRRFLLVISYVAFIFIYLVLHEGGHLAALAVWGAWDSSKTDLVGIAGRPHVSGRMSAQLTPFKIAIAALAGPILPTLLGYALFALWISVPGHRWRESRLWLDVFWSVWTVLLVLPQAAATPLKIASPDADYSAFVKNIGLPLWLSNSLLLAIALINAVVIFVIVRHIVLRIRASRRGSTNSEISG
jgi:hypothetical protein